jgi:Undecaprenyl-phosphate glucose phosphotransferase
MVRFRTDGTFAEPYFGSMLALKLKLGALPARYSRSAIRIHGRDFASLASDLLPPCDFICLLVAAHSSTLLYSLLFPELMTSARLWIDRGNAAMIGAVVIPFLLYDAHFAVSASRGHTRQLIRSYTHRCLLIAAIVCVIAMTSRLLDDLPLLWVITWLCISLALTSGTRLLAAKHVRVLRQRGVLTESIAVVGSGAAAERLLHHLRQTRCSSIELLGCFSEQCTSATGSIEQLIELGRTRAIDWILVAQPESDDDEDRLQAMVQRLKVLPAPIALCPYIGAPLPCRRVDYAGDGMPMLLLADRPIQAWDAVVKGVEDKVLGSLLTLLLLPVFALIALAIRLDSPGPIIFKQRRHAFNNTEFDVYKFRTMRWRPQAPGEALQQTLRSDPRVTRIGRSLRATSLDELPQLFNVLKGEMSLVGPRPHAVNMRTQERLGSEITEQYAHRHRVKPGMTGWAQVNGSRGPTETLEQLQRRIELDLFYIDNWNLRLDLKILVLTIREVLKRTNAY